MVDAEISTLRGINFQGSLAVYTYQETGHQDDLHTVCPQLWSIPLVYFGRMGKPLANDHHLYDDRHLGCHVCHCVCPYKIPVPTHRPSYWMELFEYGCLFAGPLGKQALLLIRNQQLGEVLSAAVFIFQVFAVPLITWCYLRWHLKKRQKTVTQAAAAAMRLYPGEA
jgi:hypothetical protein